MAKKTIPPFIICLFIFCSATPSFSQSQIKYAPKEVRNNWGIGFTYSESGVGLASSIYAPIGKSTDLFLNLLISGVSDARELERYDVHGNSIVPDKVNRVFMIPLSIGLKKQLFKDDIEGEFSPVANFGLSPTLVLTNPYEKNFFSAIGDTKARFAFGGFGGIGVQFKQSETIAMSVNINYYYIPVIGEPIVSIQNNTITDVGGFQLAFALNFLK